MSERENHHPLQRTLARTQLQLQSALEDVCDDISIPDTNTEELIRIEETLALASDAAKTVISLRQRIADRGDSNIVS